MEKTGKEMQFIIVSGVSGAGKTVALKTLEDIGYFCVDNLPLKLIEQFAGIMRESGSRPLVAVGVDIRSGEDLAGMREILDHLKDSGLELKILFLDAADNIIVKRYKETRRTHPLSRSGRIEDGLEMERRSLLWLKERADYVIDTSMLLARDLKNQVERIFTEENGFRNLYITILSFGFKHGIPEDADLVFDVRFLPNPYYEDKLRLKTGLDPEVREYSLGGEDGGSFLQKLFDMIDFLLPRYVNEGKNQLVIAFGCTGGKHRSVSAAVALYDHLSGDDSYGLNIRHRDILL